MGLKIASINNFLFQKGLENQKSGPFEFEGPQSLKIRT